MTKIDLHKRIIVGLTGNEKHPWRPKMAEINRLKIKEAALFLECFERGERNKIYQTLLHSGLKSLPLVHIRNDMEKEELSFLVKNYKTSYFTIHEDSFKFLKNWQGFYQQLSLELNTDNFLSKNVQVEKIGGFCIDLAHFKVEEQKWSKEFLYVLQRRQEKKLFDCNHLNGYSYQKNHDMHTVRSLKDFDYLKTLPRFIFGQVIALETFNSITEQIKFKEYLIKSFKNLFK